MDEMKEKFLAYEEVRQSGLTNMFAINTVIDLADEMCGVELSKNDCLDIMQNYGEYKTRWLDN